MCAKSIMPDSQDQVKTSPVPFHTICEVTDSTSPHAVNTMLAEGWILLAVCTGASYEHDWEGHAVQTSEPIYVLGRTEAAQRRDGDGV